MSTNKNASWSWKDADKLESFDTPEWSDILLNELDYSDPKLSDILNKPARQARKRLRALADRLKGMMVAKGDIIDMVIVCAIAQQPMLLIGKPGTAKSMIISKFCEGLGVGRMGSGKRDQSFHYLLHGFTEPDEILGIIDIAKLTKEQEPKFVRIPEGSITEASVIFLDEVFKANSAILNALLNIINERKVYEGGQIRETNARMIYGASNKIPPAARSGDLKAFLDRFIIRMHSELIPIEANEKPPSEERRDLLKKGWEAEVGQLRSNYGKKSLAKAVSLDQIACLNDILLCNRFVSESYGGSDFSKHPGMRKFEEIFHRLISALAGGQDPKIEIDDRKFIKLFLVAKTHGFYQGPRVPIYEDLVVLKHVWDNEEQSKIRVEAEVERVMNILRGAEKDQSSKT